jgi:hypothetical protein
MEDSWMSKAIGGGIAAFGIMVTLVGVALYVYVESTRTLFGEVTGYPYRDTGTLLVILGVIVIVVGAIIAAIPSRPSQPQERTALNSSQDAVNFCPSCGRHLGYGATFCPGCGRRL